MTSTRASSNAALSVVLLIGLAMWIVGSPAQAAQSLASLSDKKEVAHFLADLSDNREVDVTVGDFRKVDLDNDGSLELVATVDYSGREFYNTLAVVWEEPQGERLQTIPVWNMESLENSIRDLDGDRREEILAPRLLTPYLGARPLAVWTSVHSLADRGYIENSSHFRTFYNTDVIPELRQNLERFRQTGDVHLVKVTEIALYKILRTVGEEPEAGLEQALRWSGDHDPLSRFYAVAVLADIDDAAAREALRWLTHDHDDEVAGFAKSVREARQREPER